MDARLKKLTERQLELYQLMWRAAVWEGPLSEKHERKLTKAKQDSPEEFEMVYAIWEQIMFEVMY